ncbi:TPA: hypothetical protein N0F65_005583 [Lagenidium giganteum]|uniref:Uncharacterized protein n=1 Tax=Lagenidium giganteum TaxID=4803 RepID=A0AAV2Z5U1_9STRA|nr:TPA: hypothetical protein N0F65_005583 [Lagenidium giganteum]
MATPITFAKRAIDLLKHSWRNSWSDLVCNMASKPVKERLQQASKLCALFCTSLPFLSAGVTCHGCSADQRAACPIFLRIRLTILRVATILFRRLLRNMRPTTFYNRPTLGLKLGNDVYYLGLAVSLQ